MAAFYLVLIPKKPYTPHDLVKWNFSGEFVFTRFWSYSFCHHRSSQVRLIFWGHQHLSNWLEIYFQTCWARGQDQGIIMRRLNFVVWRHEPPISSKKFVVLQAIQREKTIMESYEHRGCTCGFKLGGANEQGYLEIEWDHRSLEKAKLEPSYYQWAKDPGSHWERVRPHSHWREIWSVGP